MNTHQRTLFFAGSLLLCLMLVPQISLGDDMFLRIQGPNIEGESDDDVHTKEIDVLAWSGAVAQSGTTHIGGGGGAGRVSFEDLTIQKYVDRASPLLLANCASGRSFEKMTLTVRDSAHASREYLVIELEEAMITSVAGGGATTQDRSTETITLSVARIKVTYRLYSDTGQVEEEITKGWDLRRNAPY